MPQLSQTRRVLHQEELGRATDSAACHEVDDRHLQSNSASRTFTSPTSPQRSPDEEHEENEERFADNPESGNYLTSMQEDYLLGLFWQSYHPTYRIIDEAEFREHYRSLVGVNDASIAGRWYYRRSQALLTSELESPSITTLQCHIFCVVYLCNASFQNMAHTTLALAYTVESKTCMKLGRSWSAPDLIATCQLPAHDHELARLSGSTIASYDNVTWLTYSRLVATLILSAQVVYRAFYNTCGEILAKHEGTCKPWRQRQNCSPRK
ncbi:hypothetical protein BO94DRAFT_628178 [Aspergillus sclerotioniger CBS 115572]|uniref:Transcription factor domain-containing protein n=1 Tax=Aspergillus sclerotioniger CBS 115572 TaxID=1450535 RepID=A0A317VCY5_9EURO|nr:hypothetical protein BO94DRAFT_628178 [Aspergillus sclerotioniger CBS 115572]PWY71111.1 hypothetical protein BO94DRAFT_628178 [Aspergillus sclerotioniger CBS 115572]